MGFMNDLKQRMDKVVKQAGTLLASEELHKERIDICNSCEFLIVTRNCKKCGCFVDAKARLAHSSCPIRKW